jgi:hypothetical protein
LTPKCEADRNTNAGVIFTLADRRDGDDREIFGRGGGAGGRNRSCGHRHDACRHGIEARQQESGSLSCGDRMTTPAGGSDDRRPHHREESSGSGYSIDSASSGSGYSIDSAGYDADDELSELPPQHRRAPADHEDALVFRGHGPWPGNRPGKDESWDSPPPEFKELLKAESNDQKLSPLPHAEAIKKLAADAGVTLKTESQLVDEAKRLAAFRAAREAREAEAAEAAKHRVHFLDDVAARLGVEDTRGLDVKDKKARLAQKEAEIQDRHAAAKEQEEQGQGSQGMGR